MFLRFIKKDKLARLFAQNLPLELISQSDSKRAKITNDINVNEMADIYKIRIYNSERFC